MGPVNSVALGVINTPNINGLIHRQDGNPGKRIGQSGDAPGGQNKDKSKTAAASSGAGQTGAAAAAGAAQSTGTTITSVNSAVTNVDNRPNAKSNGASAKGQETAYSKVSRQKSNGQGGEVIAAKIGASDRPDRNARVSSARDEARDYALRAQEKAKIEQLLVALSEVADMARDQSTDLQKTDKAANTDKAPTSAEAPVATPLDKVV